MTENIHPRLSLLSDEAFAIVVATAAEKDVSPIVALNSIIKKWAEDKDREEVHKLAFSSDANNIIERVTALERQSKTLFRAIEADRRSQSID